MQITGLQDGLLCKMWGLHLIALYMEHCKTDGTIYGGNTPMGGNTFPFVTLPRLQRVYRPMRMNHV